MNGEEGWGWGGGGGRRGGVKERMSRTKHPKSFFFFKGHIFTWLSNHAPQIPVIIIVVEYDRVAIWQEFAVCMCVCVCVWIAELVVLK